jgi:hypothetical protein
MLPESIPETMVKPTQSISCGKKPSQRNFGHKAIPGGVSRGTAL